MSAHIYKIIEIVGTSEESSDQAVKNAIARASNSVKNMRWAEIEQTRAHIENNEIHHWQVVLKVGFTLSE